jgi:hypothetical protein
MGDSESDDMIVYRDQRSAYWAGVCNGIAVGFFLLAPLVYGLIEVMT